MVRKSAFSCADQQRWIDNARIIDLESDLVTIRYETEEEDEISSWEEMVRLESIGAVSRKLARCCGRILILMSRKIVRKQNNFIPILPIA
jgi:endonuclease I